jgi:hypothetical protein
VHRRAPRAGFVLRNFADGSRSRSCSRSVSASATPRAQQRVAKRVHADERGAEHDPASDSDSDAFVQFQRGRAAERLSPASFALAPVLRPVAKRAQRAWPHEE